MSDDKQLLRALDLICEAICDLADGDRQYARAAAGEARSIIADLILHTKEADHA